MIRALFYSKHKIFLLVILFLYAALVSVGVYYHEPWRDEALVWNIARENSIRQIFDNVKYSGTPVLWFLILVPFAKTGFPYATMSIVHAAIAISAVSLILFFGRISLFTKVIFIFSYYMVYEYAVIARNYVLDAFLLFGIASLYPKRLVSPIPIGVLVALLYQVNSYSFGVALGLSVVFAIEFLFKRKPNRSRIISVSLMSFSGILFVLTLLPPHTPIRNVPMDVQIQFRNILRDSVIPFFDSSSFGKIFLETLTTVSVILTACLLISLTILLARRKLLLLLAAIILGWHVLLNVYLHLGYLRHHGLLLIYIIFLWWILGNKVDHVWEKICIGVFVVALNILLIISIALAGYVYYWDFRYPFTGAKDMATYIKIHGLETLPIISYVGYEGEAVLPYFSHKQFWFAEYEKFGYFPLSDPRYYMFANGFTIWDVLQRVKSSFPDNQKILLLLTVPLPQSEKKFVLLHTSLTKYFWGSGEDFWLYTNR